MKMKRKGQGEPAANPPPATGIDVSGPHPRSKPLATLGEIAATHSPASRCTCGNLVQCTCDIDRVHNKNCRFRIAAGLSVELPCEHGYQACPECDPCSCGLDVTGIR